MPQRPEGLLRHVDKRFWRDFSLAQQPGKSTNLDLAVHGNTHPFVPRRMMTWLPDWRTFTKPARSSALTIAAPDVLGSLGMYRDAEHCDYRMPGRGQRKFGKIKCGRFFEIRDRFFDRFPLGRSARFRVQGDIATFFGRRKYGGQFHRYTSVYKEPNCRAFSGLMPNRRLAMTSG